MSIFIYNHRTDEQIDIPEGYVPIPNDFPVEEGDLTYVRNPLSKQGIVDVLVPGVWVERLGENSWISESISIRPINNKKQQLPAIFDYIAASNELTNNILWSYLCDDADVTTQDILEAELQRYLNSEQFSNVMLQSTVALIKKEIEEGIQKRKESVAVPPGKLKLNVEKGRELLSPLGAMLRELIWNRETDEGLPKIDRNVCESCTKQNRVSPPLPGHDRARRYFRVKKTDK